MAALEDPEHYTFTRNGVVTNKSDAPVTMARWTDVLSGKMLAHYMDSIGLGAAMRNLKAYYVRNPKANKSAANSGFKVGLSQGGKPLDMGSLTGDRGNARDQNRGPT